MAASVEYRQEEISSCETKVQENGDDLSLFVDFSGVNLNLELLQKSNQFQEALDSESENPLIPDTTSIIHGQDSGAGDLLNSENNTTDYDWLLSPRHNLLEMEKEKTFTALISNSPGLENPPKLTTSTTNKLPSSTNVLKSSNTTIKKPSASTKTSSRSSTPTSRVPLAPAKRSITPRSSRLPAATSAPRSSTPTPRPSTTANSASRSSTPTARPSTTARSASRSSTPTPTLTARPTVISSTKSTSRSSTPSVKSRPSKNPPENTNKSLPKRSASLSKERPSQPNAKLDITETNSKAVPKRTSCSPSRGHVSVKSGVMKKYSNGTDDVNPVLMGTKMVERVVNMRKLAPPKQDQTSGKLSVSQDNTGFGRSLSKKSFDMALRHLDIRRSMPGNVRAMITKVPASSVYSVRSESMKSQTVDSPLATSSSASSENGNSYSQ